MMTIWAETMGLEAPRDKQVRHGGLREVALLMSTEARQKCTRACLMILYSHRHGRRSPCALSHDQFAELLPLRVPARNEGRSRRRLQKNFVFLFRPPARQSRGVRP